MQKRFLLTAIVFILTFSTGTVLVYFKEQNNTSKLRKIVTEVTAAQSYSISQQLDRSLSATYALASLLRQYGEITDFDTLAEDMINRYGGISSLQMAPDGVVTKIFPLQGNEAAIGHDLLHDPNRRDDALRTIESRKLTLAGPFELVQGGVAVIGRYPVFLPDKKSGVESFWGFTIALIRLPALLEATNVNQIVDNGYHYELSRNKHDKNERFVFAKSNHLKLHNPVTIDFKVPNGKWNLSIEPQNGWLSSSNVAIEVFMILFIASVVSVLFYQRLSHLSKLSMTNEVLTKEISERKRAEEEKERLILELREALAQVKTLKGMLPICASCHKIRDDKGYWNQVADYISTHTDVEFTHSICPECAKKLYSTYMKDKD
jgi:sensor domain CHASE-containing protein